LRFGSSFSPHFWRIRPAWPQLQSPATSSHATFHLFLLTPQSIRPGRLAASGGIRAGNSSSDAATNRAELKAGNDEGKMSLLFRSLALGSFTSDLRSDLLDEGLRGDGVRLQQNLLDAPMMRRRFVRIQCDALRLKLNFPRRF
jgi:hypothetical protein